MHYGRIVKLIVCGNMQERLTHEYLLHCALQNKLKKKLSPVDVKLSEKREAREEIAKRNREEM